MIRFNKNELRDKIYACWMGKNIGGTLGTPFENKRGLLNCTGFSTEAGAPLPNDDLDLQLVWLKAFREVGPAALNSKLLGEYWIEYITPFWNEYGISKANMKRGIVPPLSGQFKNHWKNSNGAWIRTEIWACLYPGDVESAIRFAYEDSSVDHGSGEGTYAAIFVAAVEAAAFVINDLRKLLEIGLSKIPANSKMHLYITKAIECYDSGMTWQEAQKTLTDMTVADPELGWFQAPANVGYTVIALLYGNGDFKNTLLIACNCGDDTDCTCATAGSILGIMYGTGNIPDDWSAHIGTSIVTCCLNLGSMEDETRNTGIPADCNELTDMVMAQHQISLLKSNIEITDDATDFSESDVNTYMGNDFAMQLENRSNYYTEYEALIVKCLVEYDRSPEIAPNGEIKIKLSLKNKFVSQKIYTVEWFMPNGWTVNGAKSIFCMSRETSASEEYTISANESVCAKNTIIAAISCDGHFDTLLIPVILMG